MEICLLGDYDRALDETLTVQGADVARPASEPEVGEDIIQAGDIEIGHKVGR